VENLLRMGGYWFTPCWDSDPCLHTYGNTSNIYLGSPDTCCCVGIDDKSETESDECHMPHDGSFNPWSYQYCYTKAAGGYCSMIPFCVADGVTAASEPCSCAGDKILSACEAGETCDGSGNCCLSSASCKTGQSYTPEAYFFYDCKHSWSSERACKHTDGVTSNNDGSTMECCCLDQRIDVYNNTDLCMMSDMKEWSYDYCYNGGFDAYCSILKFCSVGNSATELCSCPGDKLLSTCSIGEVCGTDGKCCSSSGKCTTGSKDEMYLPVTGPAISGPALIEPEPLPPAKNLLCKHTNGLTSDQKDCECGKYAWCLADQFCFFTSSINSPALCLHQGVCPANNGTLISNHVEGCACVTSSKGGSYCTSDQYCDKGVCLDQPRCTEIDGTIKIDAPCWCGNIACDVGQYCELRQKKEPLCLDFELCKRNDGGPLSLAPTDGCTCFIYGRAHQCSSGTYCHSNGCRIMSQTMEIVLYVLLALVIVCSLAVGVFLWIRKNRYQREIRCYGAELEPAHREQDQPEGVVVVGPAGIPGVRGESIS